MIFGRTRWEKHKEKTNTHKILVGIHGKRPLGRPRSRWEYIKNYIFEKSVRMWIGLIWLITGSYGQLL
jgi:hypothetical protein